MIQRTVLWKLELVFYHLPKDQTKIPLEDVNAN